MFLMERRDIPLWRFPKLNMNRKVALGLVLVVAFASVAIPTAAATAPGVDLSSAACGTGLVGAVCVFTCTVYVAAVGGRCPL